MATPPSKAETPVPISLKAADPTTRTITSAYLGLQKRARPSSAGSSAIRKRQATGSSVPTKPTAGENKDAAAHEENVGAEVQLMEIIRPRQISTRSRSRGSMGSL